MSTHMVIQHSFKGIVLHEMYLAAISSLQDFWSTILSSSILTIIS